MPLQKEVNTHVHGPSKKFLNLSVELRNEPGALMSVLNVLSDLRFNVLGSFSTVDPGSRTGRWGAFLEDPDGSLRTLKSKLRALPFVVGFEVEESKDGYLVDLIHFPLVQSGGERAIMMTSKHLLALGEQIARVFGSGGPVILFGAAQAYGRSVFEERRAVLGKEFCEANLKEALGTCQALGWFRFEEVTKEKDRVTIRVSGNFECEGVKSAKSFSDFVRGHLSGALTALLGKPMKCEETTCIARGDRFCEFVLAPA